jgi:hypothetical protein
MNKISAKAHLLFVFISEWAEAKSLFMNIQINLFTVLSIPER